MAWQTLSSGSTFEQQAPYSRALFDDEWVFVSGTTGHGQAAALIPGMTLRVTSRMAYGLKLSAEPDS